MIIQSIALGLIGVFCILDSRLLGRMNFERPLIVSTLVGLVLGDLEKGLMVGASLELMSLGIVNIGAAAPPDMNMASIIATSFAILSNANAETAFNHCDSNLCFRTDVRHSDAYDFVKFDTRCR